MDLETLTIVLPTANRQDQIVQRLETVIDELSDLCDQVQVVVVDDASTDSTPEILEELSRRFPQLSLVRNRKRLGPKRSVELGLGKSTGNFVFLHESYDSVDVRAVKDLWSLRHERDLVIARSGSRSRRVDNALLSQLSDWGKKMEELWNARNDSTKLLSTNPQSAMSNEPIPIELQMIKRDAISQLARVDAKESALEVSHLSQRKLVRLPMRSK